MLSCNKIVQFKTTTKLIKRDTEDAVCARKDSMLETFWRRRSLWKFDSGDVLWRRRFVRGRFVGRRFARAVLIYHFSEIFHISNYSPHRKVKLSIKDIPQK